MGKDAKIRVRLDLTGARADLANLYRDMGNAPGVGGGGMPSIGATGTGPAPGGGGFAGMGLGRLFGLALGATGIAPLLGPGLHQQSSMMNGLLGGFGQAAANGLYGDIGADARGDRRALDEVKGMMGLAIGLRGKTEEERKALAERAMPLFETMARVTRAEERGSEALETVGSMRITKRTGENVADRFMSAIEKFGRYVEKLTQQ
ncbi:MAG: hypothetical protein AB7T63_14900 [Planctomycetota bacterium]